MKAFITLIGVIFLVSSVNADSLTFDGGEHSEITVAAASDYKECPNCGEDNIPEAKYCWKCGTELPDKPKEEYNFCPHCGSKVTAGASFCSECGGSLTETRKSRITRIGPTGQSGLGIGAGVIFGGGDTAGQFEADFMFGIGRYLSVGPWVAVSFGGGSVVPGGGLGLKFYIVPQYDLVFQPYISVGVGYSHQSEMGISVNTIVASGGFGLEFPIPESFIAPYVGFAGGVNRHSASFGGLSGSNVVGVFGFGGGIVLNIW